MTEQDELKIIRNKWLQADAECIKLKCQVQDLEQNRQAMRAELAIKDKLIEQMELNISELVRMSNLNHTLES